jgi:hypothetical protein
MLLNVITINVIIWVMWSISLRSPKPFLSFTVAQPKSLFIYWNHLANIISFSWSQSEYIKKPQLYFKIDLKCKLILRFNIRQFLTIIHLIFLSLRIWIPTNRQTTKMRKNLTREALNKQVWFTSNFQTNVYQLQHVSNSNWVFWNCYFFWCFNKNKNKNIKWTFII